MVYYDILIIWWYKFGLLCRPPCGAGCANIAENVKLVILHQVTVTRIQLFIYVTLSSDER